MATPNPSIIYLPIMDTEHLVAFDQSETEKLEYYYPILRDLLNREMCPLIYWRRVALVYYHNKLYTQFEELLQDAEICINSSVYRTHEAAKNTESTIPAVHNQVSCEDTHIVNACSLCFFYCQNALQASQDPKACNSFLKQAQQWLSRAETYSGIPNARKYIHEMDMMHLIKRDPHSLSFLSHGIVALTHCKLCESQSESTNYLAYASSIFNQILSFDPIHLLARLGLAFVYTCRSQWKSAYEQYCQALSFCITKHILEFLPYIYYALGICLNYLKQWKQAQEAFQRCLELNPNYAQAWYGIAGIQDLATSSGLQNYLHAMESVMEQNHSSSILFCHLANHFFFMGNIQQAELHLQKGLKKTLQPSLKAEYYFQMGRISHFQHDFASALTSYQTALTHHPQHPAAQHNLIQCQIHLGRLDEAQSLVDGLCKKFPKSYEAHKLAAIVYYLLSETISKEKKYETLPLPSPSDTNTSNNCALVIDKLKKAVQHLDSIVDTESVDIELLFVKAQVYQSFFINGNNGYATELKEIYTRIISNYESSPQNKTLFKSANVPPTTHDGFSIEELMLQPWEILNNLSVLQIITEDRNGALQTMKKLQGMLKQAEDTFDSQEIFNQARLQCLKVIMPFNFALLQEVLGNYSESNQFLKKLNKEFPAYSDAWLKRAAYASDRGDKYASQKYCEQAIAANPSSTLSYLMLATLYSKQGNLEKACKLVLNCIKQSSLSPHIQAYAYTLMGVLQLKILRAGFTSSSSASKSVLTTSECQKYFELACRISSVPNFCAANGLAILLAIENSVSAAWYCFRLLLEEAGAYPHFRYTANRNLGLLLCTMTLIERREIKIAEDIRKADAQKLNKAYQYYTAALEIKALDLDIYMLLARYFHDCARFDEAIETLQIAQFRWPSDVRISYNLIICMDARICRDIRNQTKIMDTNSMYELKHMCEYIIQTSKYLIEIKDFWNHIEPQTLLQIRQGVLPLSKLACRYKNANFHFLPPFGFEEISHVRNLRTVLARSADKIMPHILKTLPHLEKSTQIEIEKKLQNRRLQEQLRQEKEEKKKLLEQEKLSERTQQDEMELQLMHETNAMAATIPTKKDEIHMESRGRNKHRFDEMMESDNYDSKDFDVVDTSENGVQSKVSQKESESPLALSSVKTKSIKTVKKLKRVKAMEEAEYEV